MNEPKTIVVVQITPDMVERGLDAREILKAIGGKGGGTPTHAEGILVNGQNS